MLAFYMVLKGCEILQIALASTNESRRGLILFGALVLVACIFASIGFISMQEEQAVSIGNMPGL
jgi:hypothetical protein